MYRLFVLGMFCMAFAVTACDSGGKKRATIRRGDKGKNAGASEKGNALNKAIEDKKCLRLDKLFQEIVKLKDDTVVIYTSDLNLGNVTGGGAGAQPTFESQVDEKVRAAALLGAKDREPILQSVRAADIQSRTHIAFLLSVSAIDQDCKVAAFENTGMKASYDIIKAGPGALWLKSKEGNEFLFYQYDRKNKLTITQFTPNATVFCDKTPNFLKRKYIVAREEANDALVLDRSFAQMLADNMEEPAELTSALGKDAAGRTGGAVTVKFSTMKALQEILQDERFQKPACPAK